MLVRKTKPLNLNDMKLDTIVVLNSMSKLIDFGFKRSRIRDTGSSFLTLSYRWSRCIYKVQILCTNALQAVIGSGSNIMPECI